MYIGLGKIPERLIDVNIASDYAKLGKMLDLCHGEENQLEEKQKEAREQITEYEKFEEMKTIEKLNKYTVIAVVDKIYIEKID